jgi:hypothetical protein
MSNKQVLTEQLSHFVFLQNEQAEMIADYITRKYNLTEIQKEADKPNDLIPIQSIVYDYSTVVANIKPPYCVHPKEPLCLMINDVFVCSVDLLKNLSYERIKKHKNDLDKFMEHEYFGDYYEIVDKIYIQKHLEVTNDGRITDIQTPTTQQIFGG